MQRSLIATLVLGTVALFGTFAAKAAPQYDDRYYGGGQVVRCDSNDNRYRECRMDTRGGVRLVRQVSKTRCEEGRNWGRLRDGVWVDRGCRAEFASGRGGGWDSAQRIRCESIDGRSRSCPVNGRGEVLLCSFHGIPQRIVDQGDGFDWQKFLEFDPERAFDPNGRGIAMARLTSFASLAYEGRGNIVTATVARSLPG